MHIRKNRYFTLIEVLFFFIIVGIVSGFVGIHIKKSIVHYKTDRNFCFLKEKFLFAKNAALSNQADMVFFVKQKKNKILISLGFDEGGIFPWQKRQKYSFSFLSFKFLEKGKATYKEELKLIFTSNGNVFPKGKFFIYKNDGSLYKKIDLEKICLKEI